MKTFVTFYKNFQLSTFGQLSRLLEKLSTFSTFSTFRLWQLSRLLSNFPKDSGRRWESMGKISSFFAWKVAIFFIFSGRYYFARVCACLFGCVRGWIYAQNTPENGSKIDFILLFDYLYTLRKIALIWGDFKPFHDSTRKTPAPASKNAPKRTPGKTAGKCSPAFGTVLKWAK